MRRCSIVTFTVLPFWVLLLFLYHSSFVHTEFFSRKYPFICIQYMTTKTTKSTFLYRRSYLYFSDCVLYPFEFLPLYQIGDWIRNGLENNRSIPYVWDAVLGSLVISTMGGLIVVFLALFPAWSSSQYSKWKWLKQSIYLSSALPGCFTGICIDAIWFDDR